jgi:hypothetical protein
MIPVGGDNVIVVAHEGNRSRRDGFLADVNVKESTHLANVVEFESRLFKATDAEHLTQQVELVLGFELGVDRCFREIGRLFFYFGFGHALAFQDVWLTGQSSQAAGRRLDLRNIYAPDPVDNTEIFERKPQASCLLSKPGPCGHGPSTKDFSLGTVSGEGRYPQRPSSFFGDDVA